MNLKSIYVGNLFYGAMEKEVRELFSHHGHVETVRFIIDWKKGRFRGFGFVEMPEADADRAIAALNNHPFQGRPLRVRAAQQAQAAVA